MERLINWLIEKGAQISPCTEIRSSKDPRCGNGLFLDTFEPDDVGFPTVGAAKMADIPIGCCINANYLLELAESNAMIRDALCALVESHPAGFAVLTERMCIVAFLIMVKVYAKELPEIQEWTTYTETLPSMESFEKSNPLFWDNEKLAMLKGTPLGQAINAKQMALSREIEHFRSSFVRTLDNHFNSKDSSMFDAKDFLWADMVFWSRVISFSRNVDNDNDEPAVCYNPETNSFDRPEMHLVPFIDFANHSNTPNVQWEIAKDETSISLQTYPGVELKAGMELLLSYGSKSNLELLFNHGFLLDGNEMNEAISFPLFIDNDDELMSQKVASIRSLRLSPMIEIEARKLQEFEVSRNIKDLVSARALQALLISQADTEAALLKQISEPGDEEEYSERIITSIASQLNSLKTQIDPPSGTLPDSHAKTYVIQTLAFLEKCMQTLTK